MSELGPHRPITADTCSRFAAALHACNSMHQVIDRVAEFAREALPCSDIGVALGAAGRPSRLLWATNPVMERADQIQPVSGRDPWSTAMREQTPLLIGDISIEDRWPQWAALHSASGVRSVLYLPLVAGDGSTIGVLGLYGRQPNAFSADDQTAALILARHAAIAVATTQSDNHLRRAVESGRVVGQATGILMERFQFTASDAFEVLKRYSQDGNVKLRAVAQHMITTGQLPQYRGRMRGFQKRDPLATLAPSRPVRLKKPAVGDDR